MINRATTIRHFKIVNPNYMYIITTFKELVMEHWE